MCKLCDLRIETEKMLSEQQFRYQVEINANRQEATDLCEKRIKYLQNKILGNFRLKRSLEIQDETMGSIERMN